FVPVADARHQTEVSPPDRDLRVVLTAGALGLERGVLRQQVLPERRPVFEVELLRFREAPALDSLAPFVRLHDQIELRGWCRGADPPQFDLDAKEGDR